MGAAELGTSSKTSGACLDDAQLDGHTGCLESRRVGRPLVVKLGVAENEPEPLNALHDLLFSPDTITARFRLPGRLQRPRHSAACRRVTSIDPSGEFDVPQNLPA